MLLDNKYSPSTNSFGFLEAPLEEVAPKSREWLFSLGWKVVRDFKANLDEALAGFEPLNLSKVLLLNTRSTWTALFVPRNDKPQSEVRTLSKRLSCRGLIVSYRDNTYVKSKDTGHLGSCQFQLFTGDAKTNSYHAERSIAVVNEGNRWVFFERGDVLPFEDTKLYEERLKRKRFTPEALVQYCKAIGIDPFNEDFYGNNCVLFARSKELHHTLAPLTYAAAKAKMDRITE